MTPSILQASVSKTATFDGAGLDISAMLSSAVARIKIKSLTAGKTVVFALQDSADGFSADTRTLATFHVKGEIKTSAPREKDFHNWEMPAVRFGTVSATLRLSIISIDAATTVVYEAFVQPGA